MLSSPLIGMKIVLNRHKTKMNYKKIILKYLINCAKFHQQAIKHEISNLHDSLGKVVNNNSKY